MRRRDFIKVIGSTVAWPLAARAQAPTRGQQKVPTVGFLGGGTAASIWRSWAAAYVKRLAELGWIEHRTIAIEYRWAEGRSDRFAEIAAETGAVAGAGHRCAALLDDGPLVRRRLHRQCGDKGAQLRRRLRHGFDAVTECLQASDHQGP